MNITKDGWIFWAIKDPGPPERWAEFNNATTPVDAIYHHSFEGWFNPVSEGGRYSVMNDPDRYPTAWHGTVTGVPCRYKGVVWPAGTLFQHYPINARLQHANAGNVIGPGFELEGTAPTPITDAQIATFRAIHRDIAEWRGKGFARDGTGRVGLVEHREAPGAQTSCPGHRYDRLWIAIATGEEEEEMTADEVREMIRAELAAYECPDCKRLNEVIQRRMAIETITLNPDVAILDQAAGALRGAGFKI